MQRSEYTSANRRAWNEVAPTHERHQLLQVTMDRQQHTPPGLGATASQILNQIGLLGKSVAQLCCNDGRELLYIKNLGADHCVGFDISDNFIEQAQVLALSNNVSCDFVRTDVYDIPSHYDDAFDLAYISVGTLGWMPDIKEFFKVVERILRVNAWVVIHEMHPILDMFDSNDVADPPQMEHSYFRSVPYIEDAGLEYSGIAAHESSPSYWFHHKLSDIIDACLANQLVLKSFQEYDRDVSNVFARFEEHKVRLPLSYTLVARKEA